MEIKRKQKYISLRCANQGFTLVELIIALAVSLLALAAIYSTFLAQHRSYQVQSETADMQQNIRAAVYYMQREIRMAGSNPKNASPAFGITLASPSKITFTEDVRGTAGPPVVLYPDGDVNDPDENITYELSGTDLVRTDNTVAPPNNTQTVAQNISALNFVYLDANRAPTATLSNIRYVQITIVAQTKDNLLYGTTNTKQYRNQQNAVFYTAPGDNVSRRLLTTMVRCRNLGL